MRVINYEKGEYKTLSFSDFYTTDSFKYEIAHSKGSINPDLKDNWVMSSKSKHLTWIKCNFNYIKDMPAQELLLKLFCSEGRCRKKYMDDDYYRNISRNTYIKDIKNFYSVFNKNGVNKNLQYYFVGTEARWSEATNKAVCFLKKWLNGWSDEKIELYYEYAYHKWNQTKNVYIHQAIKGNLPYVFFDYRILPSVKKESKSMSILDLRKKLQSKHALYFLYKGMKVTVYPPILIGNKTYDFSKSIFINDVSLSQIKNNSKEYIVWNNTENTEFKRNLYELICSNMFHIFSDDSKRILAKYIYNIKKLNNI